MRAGLDRSPSGFDVILGGLDQALASSAHSGAPPKFRAVSTISNAGSTKSWDVPPIAGLRRLDVGSDVGGLEHTWGEFEHISRKLAWELHRGPAMGHPAKLSESDRSLDDVGHHRPQLAQSCSSSGHLFRTRRRTRIHPCARMAQALQCASADFVGRGRNPAKRCVPGATVAAQPTARQVRPGHLSGRADKHLPDNHLLSFPCCAPLLLAAVRTCPSQRAQCRLWLKCRLLSRTDPTTTACARAH